MRYYIGGMTLANNAARLKQLASIIRLMPEAIYSPVMRDETPRDLQAIAAEMEQIASKIERAPE